MNSEFLDFMRVSQFPIHSFNNNDDKMQQDNNSTTTSATIASSVSQPKRRTTIPKCIDKTKTLLSTEFEPSVHSVICGNKRKYFNSPGNCRLRVLVKTFTPQFAKAAGKLEKGYIVSKVMNMIRDSCSIGSFVAFENGRWWEVSERTSREKVGSYFRDCLSNKYASSAKNKIAKRKTKREETKKQPTLNSLPEAVASLPPIQLTGLLALQMDNLNDLPCHTSLNNNTFPNTIQQLVNLPNLMMQQQQQQQLQHFATTQQFVPQYQSNFVLDDGDSSISSGTSASFYDVDDLAPVPLLEL